MHDVPKIVSNFLPGTVRPSLIATKAVPDKLDDKLDK